MPAEVGDSDWGKLDEIGAELANSESSNLEEGSASKSPTPDEPQPETPDEPEVPEPETELEPEEDDGKGITLEDGTVIPLEKILQWQANEAKNAKDAEEPDRLQELENKITELTRAPEQVVVDPFERPGDWMTVRRDEYLAAGWRLENITMAMLQSDLALRQNDKLREGEESRTRELQEVRAEIEALRNERAVEQELTRLQQKYVNLQGDLGEEVLGLFLAKAEKLGEKDLEKVAKAANDHVNKVVTLWAGKKREAVRGVVRNMPRGGGSRLPPAKDYGTGLDSLEKMSNDLK